METIWKYFFSNIVAFALWVFYFWMNYVKCGLVFGGSEEIVSPPPAQMILVAHSSIQLFHLPVKYDLARNVNFWSIATASQRQQRYVRCPALKTFQDLEVRKRTECK